MRAVVLTAIATLSSLGGGCFGSGGATMAEVYSVAAARAAEWNEGAWLMSAGGTVPAGWIDGRAIAWSFRFHADGVRDEFFVRVDDDGNVVNATTNESRSWDHPSPRPWELGSDDAVELAMKDATFREAVGEMREPLVLSSLEAYVMLDPKNRTSYPANGTWAISAHDVYQPDRAGNRSWGLIFLDAVSGSTYWSSSDDGSGVLPTPYLPPRPDEPGRATYYEDDVQGLLTPDRKAASVTFPVEVEGASAAVMGCYGRTLYVGSLKFSVTAPNGTIIHHEVRTEGRGAGSLYWSEFDAPAGDWELAVEIDDASVSDYRLLIWVGDGFDERDAGACWNR